ncbi:uncharacterized protein LOC129271341 [Lytechinus pictus]|uniref:uncharacterized protein LOC129271341 n=1 Tax=Lytechinus pictus TaxID=7653 RepID=UPI0030B9D651
MADSDFSNDDNVTSLKHSCRGYIGTLSRLYKELEVLMADFENKDAVVQKHLQLERVFTSYKEKSDEYISELSGAEAEAASEKFERNVENNREFRVRLQDWMEAAEKRVDVGGRPADVDGDVDDDRRSVRSSRSSSSKASRFTVASSTSSARLREARAKAAVARLNRQHMAKAHELKQEQLKLEQKLAAMEADKDIAAAEVELQCLEEESDDESQVRVDKSNKIHVNDSTFNDVKTRDNRYSLDEAAHVPMVTNLNPNAPEYTGIGVKVESVKGDGAAMSNMTKMFNALDLVMNMPKPEMKVFDGNPLDYCAFISSFDATVASKISDDRAKLTYLIQYCSSKAKDSIENCVFLGPQTGYQKARDILENQFGQPYMVATAHMKKVLSRQPIRPNDGEALWDLARGMRKCQMVLSQGNYRADMDSTENLLRIQQFLPVHLQSEWARRAHSMMTRFMAPTFEAMTMFIEESAQLSSNLFGQNIGKSKNKPSDKSSKPKGGFKVTTMSTQSNPAAGKGKSKAKSDRSCLCCSGRHNLEDCRNFVKKSFEERRNITRKHKLCDNCFRPSHMSSGCMMKSRCTEKGCQRKHHTLLHAPASFFKERKLDKANPKKSSNSQESNSDTGAGSSDEEASSREAGDCYSSVTSQGKVSLRVLPVKVQGNGREVQTWALLDEGSDISICSKDLVRDLGMTGSPRRIQLTTVNGVDSQQGEEVSLKVRDIHYKEELDIPRVWTVKSLPLSDSLIPDNKDLLKWRHLRGIEFPSIDAREVKLLIGADTPEAFWVLEQRRGKRKEPYAIRCPLGWTLMGPTTKSKETTAFHVNFARLEDERLQDQVKKFWELDHVVEDNPGRMGESIQDMRARELMRESIKLVDGHYEVGLPWKYPDPGLENNRHMAEVRLKYLERRLKKDSNLAVKYTETVQGYIEKGYAEKVPRQKKEANLQTSCIWYLPHHPVVHPHKPDKVRVVFDCAAKYRGTSLNDTLLQGPDHTNSLVGVLLRFREEPVAVVGDVEAMFHQVKVPKKDCDALRFLWWENGNLATEPVEYRMKVHLFGATSSPSCAGFALRRTAEDNRHEYDEDVVNTVLDNFYVDDCLKSVPSDKDGVRLVQQLRGLLQKGGFRLTKWVSNSREVLNSIPDTEKAPSVIDMDLDTLPIERTLGVLWDVDSDRFGFKVSLKDRPATRRGILSKVSSLYDPLGFLAPFILVAKVLLQGICQKGLAWDEPVDEKDLQTWQEWLDDLPRLTEIKIPRCLKPEILEDQVLYQLHYFCDASELGYAAVAYLRLEDSAGRIHCSFVCGKSRLSPLKVTSIPRLELAAAVLAVDMNHMIQEELRLPIATTTYWTDSTSVLMYIQNESRRFHTFVANRVAKIREVTELSQWRHVNTKLNPADDGSRGLKAQDLITNPRWLSGPDFLKQEEENWPSSPAILGELKKDDLEVKKDRVHVNTVVTNDSVQELLTRYSSWNRLKGAFAWVLRYKMFLRNRDAAARLPRGLTAEELKEAELEITKQVQLRSFPSEVMTGSGEPTRRQKASGPLDKLNPIITGGVLKVGGRLSRSTLAEDAKHPAILPRDNHVTDLIIQHYHEEVGHSGAVITLSAIRERFWIVRGGATVRKVLQRCMKCKRRSSRRGEQFMADLPAERVTPDKPPFTSTGVDFFGPFMVKRGRSEVKRYACLLTCLASRAVHIEIACSLDTDSFICALRRFINRRGKPDQVFSDNGTNFKGGHKELKESLAALNDSKVGNLLTQKGIEWRFNPPLASHMGGVWERVIRSVRKILGGLLHQQVMSDEALVTLMTEVEAILNARPLTPLSMDPKDEEPLTPNHLLLLRNNPSLPPGIFTKDESYGRRRWRHVQFIADQFWKRWVKEYLPLLQPRQKWTREKRNFEQDDLVLVADDNAPRGQWPLGKIVATYPDKQGRVRQVEVRIGSKYFRRPISKLCLLEEGKGAP